MKKMVEVEVDPKGRAEDGGGGNEGSCGGGERGWVRGGEKK